MIKRLLSSLVVLAVLTAAFSIYNGRAATVLCRLEKAGGVRPAHLTYRIYLFGILPVAEAFFNPETEETLDGKQVYHLSASARSSRVFAKLFSGQAQIDSYVDKSLLVPLIFRQRLSVTGKPQTFSEARYDPQAGVMEVNVVRRQILPDTHDPLSAIFALRRMDFSGARDFEISLNTNQKNYVLKGTSQVKEIGLGNKARQTVALLRAEIRRRDKNPYHRSKIDMLVAGREGNVPVVINVFASGVFIQARLIDIR